MIWAFILIIIYFVGVAWLSWTYLREKEEVDSSLHVISTRLHGVLDYLVGMLLIAAPWLFGFAQGGAETWVPVVLGAGAILYSLCTDYELGLLRRIPMPVHLILDGASGLFLFISPFLFGFSEEVMNPHLGFGMLEIAAALTTKPRPSSRSAPTGNTATSQY